MSEALRPLRDVRGVMGSFVVDDDGRLVAADVPELIDEGALQAASTRLAHLCDAVSSGNSLADCVLRFGDHTLFLHRFGRRTLCVLAPRPTNVAALRMGSRLASRRLAQALEAAPTPAPAAAAPAVNQPPPQPPAPRRSGFLPARAPQPETADNADDAAPARRPRFFRGRRID